MKYEKEIFEGKFLKRYKRFFADIEFDGEVITAHCPNTGSMKGCNQPNIPCRFSFVDDPKRKLKYTLEMVKTESSWVGVNTGLPNKLVMELWEKSLIKSWKDFDKAAMECKINDKSRADLVLWKSQEFSGKKPKVSDIENQKGFHFIEVKNVTMAEGDRAMFPDAVTTRGQKHIQELMKLIDMGHSAELILTVQREDCISFSPAKDIDPEYARLLKEGMAHGLVVNAYPAKLSKEGIELIPNSLPIEL